METLKKKRQTDTIEILTSEGWTTINDDNEILEHLNAEAKYHFRQAAKISFITEGGDALVREIPETVPPEKWAEEIRRKIPDWPFGEQLKFSRDVTSEIGNEDLINGFAKWRKDTTTSPSGRHLSLYNFFCKRIKRVKNTIIKTNLQRYFQVSSTYASPIIMF